MSDVMSAKPRMEHPAVTVCLGHHWFTNVGMPGIVWVCRECGWVK